MDPTTTFTVPGPPDTQVTVTQVNGELRFTITVQATEDLTADLRAFYLHMDNESVLGSLQVVGGSDSEVDEDSVDNLGGGTVITPLGPFDVGVEFGTAGIGQGDDIQTASFTLRRADGTPLTLDDLLGFDGIQFGVRLTSVGDPDGDRSGSEKFGYDPENAAIAGAKYEDMDGDGALDEGEPVVSGWAINLYKDDGDGVFDADDMLAASTVTGADGSYRFDNLDPGTYFVVEGERAGWYATGDDMIAVDLQPDQVFGEADFLNARYGSVTVTKYEDTNGDGVLSADEKTSALGAGWIFAIDDDGIAGLSAGDTRAETNVDGIATFDGLKIGEAFTLFEVLGESDPAKDGNGWYQTVGLGGLGGTVTISGGNVDLAFGNTEYGTVTVTKYEDTNGDGVLSDGEKTTPLGAGWTFYIEKDGVAGYTAGDEKDTTDDSGTVTFGGLTIGADYRIFELIDESPAADAGNGWYQTVGNAGILVEVGESGGVATAAFGNTEYGRIEATKWWDRTGDMQSDDDMILGGWTFRLTIGDDVYTVTDGGAGDADGEKNGTVVFDGATYGLEVGTSYLLEEVGKTGFTATVGGEGYRDTISTSGEVDAFDFYNTFTCPEGLTPGFWRQSQNWRKQDVDAQAFWKALDDRPGETIDGRGGQPVGDGINFTEIFNSTITFGDLFGVSNYTVKVGKARDVNIANYTLSQAVSLEGGGDAGALARHAVAAVMNASADDVDYAFTVQQVLGLVSNALDGDPTNGTIASVKALLEYNNELGIGDDAAACFLDLHGLTLIDPMGL